jgi:hypothetical protein
VIPDETATDFDPNARRGLDEPDSVARAPDTGAEAIIDSPAADPGTDDLK